MWAGWTVELARRLESVSGVALSARLYSAFGLDPRSSCVIPGSPLAVQPMAQLRELAIQTAGAAGLERAAAGEAVAAAWHMPDPLNSARPLADLPRVFRALSRRGVKTAVATSDDRAATLATLAGLGIASYVGALVGADDGLPNKPAPDMVLHLCRQLSIAPALTVVVGDAVADLQMASAAGVGWRVGVLSGVSPRALLAPYADVMMDSIGDLVKPG